MLRWFQISHHGEKPTIYLWLLVFVYGASIFDNILSSMFNFLAAPLQNFYNQSMIAHYDTLLDDTSYSITISIMAILPTFASVISIFWLLPKMDTIGRKGVVLHLKSLLMILASLCFIGSKYLLSIELFLVGRFILGPLEVIRMIMAKIYVSECSPSCYRGFFTQSTNVLLYLVMIGGMMLMQPNLLGNDGNWQYIAVLTLVLTIVFYILGLFLPESPKYLYFQNKDKDLIVKSIRTYQGKDADIGRVLESYKKESRLTSDHKLTLREVWRNPTLRKSLILILMVGFAGIFNISMVLEYYETSLLISFGLTQSTVLYANSIATMINFPLNLLSPFFLEKFGRRPLILAATFGYILLPLLAFVAKIWAEKAGPSQWTMVLGIMIICGRVLISSVTHIGTITFILVVDLMPTGAKAVATQIALLTFYIGIFIPTFLYPNLDQFIGAFAFLPFSFISLGFFVYFYFNLIETKEKEIYENLEILGHMPKRVNFVSNVKRKRATSLMPLLEDDEIVRGKMIKYDSFGV